MMLLHWKVHMLNVFDGVLRLVKRKQTLIYEEIRPL